MQFEFKLARRYFCSRRKSLVRFTSLAAVAGIAAGVASLILANALARGFADEMQDKILANSPHIAVSLDGGTEIIDWKIVKETIEKIENVAEIAPENYENSVIIGNKATSYAVLRVIQNSKFKIQHSGEMGVSIGKELAEKTGLGEADGADIVIFRNGVEPQTFKIRVTEIFQTGLYEYDSVRINISPEDFAKISEIPTFVPTILSVKVGDIYRADETANKIRKNLGENFRVVDWQEANRPLFAALSLERKVALAIISLIIFIAALNITTTLALLVNERRLDIAVLRTCGAKTRSLVAVFLLEGLFLGFLGIFIGVVLGLAGCFLGNYFKVISLSSEVYSLNTIPFHPDFINILLIILGVLILCLGATIYPALKASRIKPLENLRAQ